MNGFVVTVCFKPKRARWQPSASMKRKCHANMNRSASASWRTITSFCEVHFRRAAFDNHLPLPHLATFNKTSADLATNENVAKLHLIAEGPNIRR